MNLLKRILFFSLICFITGNVNGQIDRSKFQTDAPTNTGMVDDFRNHTVVNNAITASQEELDEWKFIVNEMQGVKGFDPVNNTIHHPPAEKTGLPKPISYFADVLNNWIPLHSDKQVCCGILQDFRTFVGADNSLGTEEEMDWNLFMFPGSEFSYLIDEAKPYEAKDYFSSLLFDIFGGWHSKVDGKLRLEGELTPDESLYENVFFPKRDNNNPEIPRVGKELCLYGPWIRERVHNSRPEIHPTEMIWWQEPNGFWMMALQDNSRRFNEKKDFDTDGAPNDWKPWAQSPLTAQFRIAFEVNPNDQGLPLKMDVREVYKKLVITKDDEEALKDSDNGSEHALIVDNKMILKVNEQQENDNDLGVKFVDIKKRQDGTIQGYVQITTKIGGNDLNGEAGYHAIYVAPTKTPSPVIPPLLIKQQIAKAKMNQEWDMKSIHTITMNGKKVLVGNLKIKNIEDAEVLNAQFLPETLIKEKGTDEFEITGLPILTGNTLEVKPKSKDKEHIVNATYKLYGFPLPEKKVQDFSEDKRAWDKLMSTLVNSNIAAPGEFVLSQNQQVRLSPMYYPNTTGRKSADKGSQLADYLNKQIFEEKGEGIKEIYQDNKPFVYNWNFKAISLISGKEVDVKTSGSGAGSNVVSVQFQTTNYLDDGIIVNSPNDNDIYELKIQLEIVDIFGIKSNTEHILYSHFLKVENTPKTVEKLMNYSADIKKTLAVKTTENSKIIAKDNSRISESLEMFYTQSIKDEELTIKELNAIVAAAKNYKE